MGKSSNKENRSTKGAGGSNRDATSADDSGKHQSSGARNNDPDSPAKPLPEPVNDSQPQTCCPSCQTVFEVVADLLAASDTRVRCGECLSIFDALINLRRDDFLDDHDILLDEEGNVIESDSSFANTMTGANEEFTSTGDYPTPSEPAEGLSNSMDEQSGEIQELDVTYSDFDLFSGEVELPEVAYFDQTQEAVHLRFDDPDGDETFSDTLFSHDLTVEPVDLSPPGPGKIVGMDREAPVVDIGFVTDDVKREPVVFRYREPGDPQVDIAPVSSTLATKKFKGKRVKRGKRSKLSRLRKMTNSPWVVRSILALVLLMIVGGLYSYRNQDAVLQNTALRPGLELICAVAGCQVPPIVDLNAIKLLKKSMFSHPTLENSLVLDVAFVNQATFEQPYPILEIRWTERNGSLVLQNAVGPSAYLKAWKEGDMLQAGERLDLSLTVEDPGQRATDFVLTFR